MNKLTIGLLTYDDFDGAYFTVQALRLYHPEAMDEVELLILEGHFHDKPKEGESPERAKVRREKVSSKGDTLEVRLPPRAIVFAKYAI
jgi:hypothetical protein